MNQEVLGHSPCLSQLKINQISRDFKSYHSYTVPSVHRWQTRILNRVNWSNTTQGHNDESLKQSWLTLDLQVALGRPITNLNYLNLALYATVLVTYTISTYYPSPVCLLFFQAGLDSVLSLVSVTSIEMGRSCCSSGYCLSLQKSNSDRSCRRLVTPAVKMEGNKPMRPHLCSPHVSILTQLRTCLGNGPAQSGQVLLSQWVTKETPYRYAHKPT